MLQKLKELQNHTYTANGAVTYRTTESDCLDLFATIGALRNAQENEVVTRFMRAYAENADLAMKILFYARDVRGGLGERKVFRIILKWLAEYHRESVVHNLPLIAEYGRYDDILILLDTACGKAAMALIAEQFEKDMESLKRKQPVSLLAKWLPSVNASSKATVAMAKRIAGQLPMTEAEYRKALTALRLEIRILENYLREKDYSFDYEKQPSRAMYKYRRAFFKNDRERYVGYLGCVTAGKAKLNTGTLTPYDVIAPLFCDWRVAYDKETAKSADVTWNALPDFTGGENALAVVDGSGSMYGGGTVLPVAVALSLGIYFAERNTGRFHNHFITFSHRPRLVEIKGKNIEEKVQYCASYNEVADTNIQKVFELILEAAVKNRLSQDEMPSALYFITDMEFNICTQDASMTNFAYAKKLFGKHGYDLPQVVFWNVNSQNIHQPVTMNEQGVMLVSGCSPRIFQMIANKTLSPYAFMLETLCAERYKDIVA